MKYDGLVDSFIYDVCLIVSEYNDSKDVDIEFIEWEDFVVK